MLKAYCLNVKGVRSQECDGGDEEDDRRLGSDAGR